LLYEAVNGFTVPVTQQSDLPRRKKHIL